MQYFYHPNTAPFIAKRLIERFGTSNPSSRYVKAVSTAFTTGIYTHPASDTSFGSGEYGNLGAVVAAVLLDREAREVVVDADPSAGSLREPFIKVVHFLRAMEFQLNADKPLLETRDMTTKIGQMAHELPNIFSYFLPEYMPAGPAGESMQVMPEATRLTGPTALGILSGKFSLIKYGMVSCDRGFGYDERPWSFCWRTSPTNIWNPSLEADYSFSSGVLTYNSTQQAYGAMLDELALLFTPGRLDNLTRTAILDAVDAHEGDDSDTDTDDEATKVASKVRLLWELFVTSPEYQTTNVVRKSGFDRDPVPEVEAPGPGYKAVVYLFLRGGADTHQMLVPKTCSNPDLYANYADVRGTVALPKTDLLEISVAGHPSCSHFGVHKKLTLLRDQYEAGNLTFFANAGVLFSNETNKNNYYEQHAATQLFAHNVMQDESYKVDAFDEFAGSGVLGRLLTVLTRNIQTGESTGVSAGANTLTDVSKVVQGVLGQDVTVNFVDQSGVSTFNARPTAANMDLSIEAVNSETELLSSIYGETWSQMLLHAMDSNAFLSDILDSTSLSVENFPQDQPGLSWRSSLSHQLEVTALMIKAQQQRGILKDSFVVIQDGYDTHTAVEKSLDNLFTSLDISLTSFVNELKDMGLYDNVTVVAFSEFGRTLTPNSGLGTDHGWAGNYFMLGGAVDGGKILGEYPEDLSNSGDLNIGRGRLIPTMPFESMWNGIAQWLADGTLSSDDLDYILPNRGPFKSVLFQASDLYKSD